MADLIGGLLGYMRDPRRTQQMQALAGLLTSANERAKGFNELNRAATDEFLQTKDIYGPKAQQLAKTLADAYNPIGLTVFHGSPAKFSKFDPTKIGSGEGAQAYGYGHYVAQSQGVAKEYSKANQGRNAAAEGLIDELPKRMQMEVFKVMQMPDGNFKEVAKQDLIKKYPESASVLGSKQGNFYEIDLPDEQIARMLDWDKPLSKQPENVQAALEKLGYKVDRADVDKYSDALLEALMTDAQVNLPKQPMDIAGEALYRKLGSPEQAAQRLREAGIPGIRYLDQASRGTGEGTSNFVVFPGNEGLLTILKRNNSLLDD